MKKVLISALAVGMLTACSQDETISMQSPTQISFEGAFVNNATRATIDPSFHNTNNPLKAFDVWAFMDTPAGKVFDGENVTGGTGAWTYTNTQYWAPNHTYYFAAIAPMNSANIDPHTDEANTYGIGTTYFRNIDGTEDFIYAATTRTTGASIDTQPEAVQLQFNHMLSKVKFSFTNGFDNDNAYITVKNIKMSVPSYGRINLAADKWWEGTGKWILHTSEPNITLEFGNMQTEKVAMGKSEESQYERLTIPTNGTETTDYDVTFDVELYYGNVLAYSNTLTTKISGVELYMGKGYDFHAEINDENIMPGNEKLYPITFEATVTPWDEWTDYNGEQIETNSVAALPEDKANVAADEILYLEDSRSITTSLNVAGTLEGQNNTLFSAKTPGDNGLVRPAGTATVKNVTIDGENRVYTDANGKEKGLRAIFINDGGTYTIDNVTIEDVTYAINVNTTAAVTLNVTNSTLEGWSSWGTSTTATFENVAFTTNPDAYGMLRPQGTATFKNCTFDANFKFSLDLLVGTLTFEGCTWNGVALTAENIKGMISTEYYAEGLDASTNLNKVVFN